jgi:cytochrome P450
MILCGYSLPLLNLSLSPSQTRVLACFKETMRLRPSVAVISMLATADAMIPTAHYNFPFNNVFIPRNTDIYLDAMALHRNRQFKLKLSSLVVFAC